MKKTVCLLAALLLLMTCALAEEYVTLAELREQAEAGWNQTYTAKGREVIANVEMAWFPEADVCPLVSVDPLVIEEDDERLDKWRNLPHSTIYALSDRISIDVTDNSKFDLVPLGSWRGKCLEDRYSYYDGEIPDRQPEDCDITYDEFLAMFEEDLLDLAGLYPDEIHIDEVWVSNPGYKGKKVNGEYVRGDKLTAAGGYALFAHQLVHGVPVLGAIQSLDKGRISYNYKMPEYRYFTFWSVTNPTVIEEDLPLLSFDAFKGKLETLIDEGKLRGVDAMRFGYGTCKDGDAWKLVPAWIVTCGYTDDPNSEKNVLAYINEDGDISWPKGYGEYYFNAQTGEMLEHYALSPTEDSLYMPEILTWDNVN